MKKLVLSLASGALAFMAFATPIAAADSGTGQVTVGYEEGAIPDPENPTNPSWKVKIPKSFNFTKAATEKAMDLTLEETDAIGFPVGKSTDISVKSKNGSLLMNTANTAKSSLTYTLVYGSTTVTGTADNSIGTMSKTVKTLPGTAKLTEMLENAAIDGTYQDVLTYTVSKAK